jgi:hypothetical protein
MNNTQRQSSLRRSKPPVSIFFAFFVVAATLIICGTTVWILNLVHIIPGPWASVFGAAFTGIGVLVALLNCLLALMALQNGRGE